jgi:hypothetical protein
MTQDLEKALEIARRLSPADLNQLQTQIKVLKSLGPSRASAPNSEVGSDDYMVLDAIVRFMQNKGIDHTSREMLRSGRFYPQFKAKVPPVMQFLKQCGVVTRQRATLMIGVELLYRDLEKMGLAVNSRSIMLQLHRVPGCINRAFPGYAQMGILNKITERKK